MHLHKRDVGWFSWRYKWKKGCGVDLIRERERERWKNDVKETEWTETEDALYHIENPENHIGL